jgi:hypothetical protein
LLKLQASTNHYIHHALHTLPPPSSQLFVDTNNGPPKLIPLDIKVIQWNIFKDGICILEDFRGISFGLTIVQQFDIDV